MISFKLSSEGREIPGLQRRMRFGRGRCVIENPRLTRGGSHSPPRPHCRPRKRHRRHRLRPRRPRPSANRLGQAARPARRRGDREQEVVELNSKCLSGMNETRSKSLIRDFPLEQCQGLKRRDPLGSASRRPLARLVRASLHCRKNSVDSLFIPTVASGCRGGCVGKSWPLHPRRTVTVGECLYDTFF